MFFKNQYLTAGFSSRVSSLQHCGWGN